MCVLLVKTYKNDKFERFDSDVDPFQHKFDMMKNEFVEYLSLRTLLTRSDIMVKIIGESNSFEYPDFIKLTMTRLIDGDNSQCLEFNTHKGEREHGRPTFS